MEGRLEILLRLPLRTGHYHISDLTLGKKRCQRAQ
jgi:hypothetical protein